MNLNRILAAAFLLASGTAVASGPIGTYYVTDFGGNASYIWGIQGTSYVKNPAAGFAEGPVAIVQPNNGPEIRTKGIYPSRIIPTFGAGYQSTPYLSVTPTGSTYSHDESTVLMDGTSDSQHNYSVAFDAGTDAGFVFRFDQDWTNAVPLFDTGKPSSIGITYDRLNQSLWISDTTDNGNNTYTTTISDFSLTGTLLSSFTLAPSPVTMTALAMDVDHTLWAVGAFAGNNTDPANGILYHYGTDGTDLGSVVLAENITAGFGGEIAGVPELDAMAGTGALSLLGFALALAAERRRRA